jgi:hypothetical protein
LGRKRLDQCVAGDIKRLGAARTSACGRWPDHDDERRQGSGRSNFGLRSLGRRAHRHPCSPTRTGANNGWHRVRARTDRRRVGRVDTDGRTLDRVVQACIDDDGRADCNDRSANHDRVAGDDGSTNDDLNGTEHDDDRRGNDDCSDNVADLLPGTDSVLRGRRAGIESRRINDATARIEPDAGRRLRSGVLCEQPRRMRATADRLVHCATRSNGALQGWHVLILEEPQRYLLGA